jgi:hypothetical protein
LKTSARFYAEFIRKHGAARIAHPADDGQSDNQDYDFS